MKRKFRRYRVFYFLIFLTVAFLIVVVVNQQGVSYHNYEQVSSTLNKIKNLDIKLNEDLLRIQGKLLSNYDPLVNNLEELQKQKNYLKTINCPILKGDKCSYFAGKLDGLVKEKQEMIERFKSNNSIVRNSIYSLPIVSEELQQKTMSEKISYTADLLVKETLVYYNNPDENIRRQIDKFSQELKNQIQTAEKDIQETIKLVLRHSENILNYKKVLDEVGKNIIELPTQNSIDKINVSYYNIFQANVKRSQLLGYFIFGIAGILALVVIITLTRLRKKSESLLTFNEKLQSNQKVLEKSRNKLKKTLEENEAYFQEIGKQRNQLQVNNEELRAKEEAFIALNKRLEVNNQQLTNTLNELQNTQHQLIHSEKMASLGQLTAGIAHEINTPLGVIKASIEIILRSLDQSILNLPILFSMLSTEKEQSAFAKMLNKGLVNSQMLSSREERKIRKELAIKLEERNIKNPKQIARTLLDINIKEYYEDLDVIINHQNSKYILEVTYHIILLMKNGYNIQTAIQKASKTVFALKSYTHFSDVEGEPEPTKLQENIDTILTLYQNQIKQGIELNRFYEANPEVLAYPDELGQVWTNLIQNAIQAMGGKGKLDIWIEQSNGTAIVKVMDRGKGMPKEIQGKVFNPFFTTKPKGEGSGLGLDIVKKIVEKHKGMISFESIENEGTTFKVELPIN